MIPQPKAKVPILNTFSVTVKGHPKRVEYFLIGADKDTSGHTDMNTNTM